MTNQLVPTAPTTPRLASQNRLDYVGIFLSGLCGIHCLALPVLVLLAPIWHESELLHAAFHPIMAVLIMPVTLRSIYNDSCGSDFLRIGLVVVWLAIPAHTVLGEVPGLLLTIVGSALLVSGHRGNIRCRNTANS